MSRAFLVTELSDDLSGAALTTFDVPPPGEGEVQVEMRACTLGFPDLLMTRGGYQFKPDLPFAPGTEGAGIVRALGAGVEGLAPGDAVMVGARSGLMAERANVPALVARPLPRGLSFEKGAALMSAYLTAYVSLVPRGQLQAGESVLVLGAAGGVGLAAVEVAKLLGAQVIAAASSEEKRALAESKGAGEVIDSGPGLRDRVKKLTDGRGVDVVYDPVGGDVFDEALRCVAWGGRYLIVGFASGRIGNIPANYPLIKGFSVVGVRAGEYGRRDPKSGRDNVAQILQWAEEGKIDPHIGARFPLEKTRDAFDLMAARGALGRIVIAMGES